MTPNSEEWLMVKRHASQPGEHPLLLIGCQFTPILFLYYLFAMYV